MTVLVGLVHEDGIAVLADRASVDLFRELAHGMPMPGEARGKVFASAGVVAGIAGAAVVPGVNLLDALAELVGSSTSPLDTHPKLVTPLAAAAPGLREHQALAAQVTPFEQPVLTVVLLGGRAEPGSPAQLVAYGIPDAGPPLFQSLQRSVVFTPASVQADAEAWALADDRAVPVAQQVQVWGRRLGQLAPLAIARQLIDICRVGLRSRLNEGRDRRRAPRPAGGTLRHPSTLRRPRNDSRDERSSLSRRVGAASRAVLANRGADLRADPVTMRNSTDDRSSYACTSCMEKQILGSAGGWHPLVHLAVGAREMCVDVGIAYALEAIWSAGLDTSQSCQAWQWWPDPAARPSYARINFPLRSHAVLGVELLNVEECLLEQTRWGHTSLLWLPNA